MVIYLCIKVLCVSYISVNLICYRYEGHIRGRLRKLMARRPERESLKTKGILEGTCSVCHYYCGTLYSGNHWEGCCIYSIVNDDQVFLYVYVSHLPLNNNLSVLLLLSVVQFNPPPPQLIDSITPIQSPC